MKIFTFRTVCGHYLRVLAKFRRDIRTVAELLQVFDFQYGGRPPYFILCTHARDHRQSDIVGLYHCAKFGLNRLSSLDNIEV